MMGATRRKFSREFKIEAVRMVTEGGQGIAETARQLGVNANMLGRWKKQLTENGEGAFPGKGRQGPLEEEVRRLQRELNRVRQERDFLKNHRGARHQPVKTETPPDVVFCVSTEGSGRPLFGGSTP
jgi:transposase